MKLTPEQRAALWLIVKSPILIDHVPAGVRSVLPTLQNMGLIWRKGNCWTATERGEAALAADNDDQP